MTKVKKIETRELKKFREYDGHEKVFCVDDPAADLRGFIAIHNTNRGNAIGGTRYFAYRNEEDALRDALNLSRAMTYKCAIAGVSQGGGKAVIMARRGGKTSELIDAYAGAIEGLGGLFLTGEDVGIDEDDVIRMGGTSRYILGLPGRAGDPSPWAALSVFHSIEEALLQKFGSDKIDGRSFAIKGVGKVGAELLRLLCERGGLVAISDIDRKKAGELVKKFRRVRAVSPEEIHKLEVDVYAPCAMGGEFSADKVRELNCRIVCGSANNQLADLRAGESLHQRGILYVPDYLANAGGLINVADELQPGGYDESRVLSRVRGIRATAREILLLSQKNNRPTSEISDKFAEGVFRVKMKR